jgi:hypothetical protein
LINFSIDINLTDLMISSFALPCTPVYSEV